MGVKILPKGKNMITLANEIKAKRKELGLTQETLALYAGVSPKFIVELESGKETVRLDKVLAVLRVFDATLTMRHI